MGKNNIHKLNLIKIYLVGA